MFAIVTHLPGQNKWNEFSIVAGYNYQPNSNPDVTIGDMKFQLFTSGSRAWSFSPSEDEKIVKYLKNSMKMKVVGHHQEVQLLMILILLLDLVKRTKKLMKL